VTDRQTGPIVIRPNTLRDQTAPNALRGQGGSGPAGKRGLNSGGGNAAPPARLVRRQLGLRVSKVAVVLAVLVALYLLTRVL
jgi:hypothetical protein